MIHCPECGEAIDIESDEVEEGERFSCPECDTGLEVVNLHPLELDIVSEGNDDFEEDENEDEEDDEDLDFEDEERDNGFR